MAYLDVACNILTEIDLSMDAEEFDPKNFTAEYFGVSEWLFLHAIDDLNENGYIGGVETEIDPLKFAPYLKVYRPYLTLKGAEFLAKYGHRRVRAHA